MSVAVAEGNVPAMIWAIFAMVLMIVVLDQLLWRPIVVWAQKFRVEEGGQQEEMHSWFLDLLRRSGIVSGLSTWLNKLRAERAAKVKKTPLKPEEVLQPSRWATWLS